MEGRCTLPPYVSERSTFPRLCGDSDGTAILKLGTDLRNIQTDVRDWKAQPARSQKWECPETCHPEIRRGSRTGCF